MAPGFPHHITQRGNRRLQTFFCDEDYGAYVSLMSEWCGQHGVEIWAYCLMPNHVHLVAVPKSEDGLRGATGAANRFRWQANWLKRKECLSKSTCGMDEF